SYSFETTSWINNHYRVRCNATADNVFANLSDTSAKVSVAELNMTSFDYENNNEYAVEEYEAGDVIDWINTTVFADNNASFSNVSLSVLDSAGSSVGWGPDEKYECGLVENQSNCNATYTNNSNGYLISDAAGSGTYQWNVTYLWLGGFKENTSNSFSLHNLVQDNFTSAINFTKIAVGEAAEYNFTIENPWSKNLTSVNVTFNCPSVSGVECNCSLSGQQTQDYCYLGNVTSGVSDNALFYISTTSGTPLDAYDLNVTVSYVNPGNTSHTWTDVQNQEIDVMGAGILGWVYSSPLNFTRGSSFGLKGYVLNKNSTEETNVTLNWSLPAYWTNQTGNLNTSFDSISSGGINWSNITVSTTISAETGAQIAYIYANSSNLIGDSHYVTLDVFANSQLLEAQVNDSDPEHGDSIKITARLRYDNNTVVSNQNVSFIDHTYGVYRGSNLTDSSGYVYLYYTIPLMAPTGTHVLNITYDGNSSIYLNPKTVQVTADVHDYPQIVELYSSPSTVGYGYNVTVYANISDDDGADSVYLYVTDPRTGAEPYLTMGDVGGGMFSVNYTAWHYGEYEYYIWVNDSYDNQNQTDTQLQNFYVRSNITLRSVTDYSSYGLNTEVYINNSNWWNSSWNYR
ncbi:MAG: hypothetical protein KAR23_04740, partial [Candidatus Aenigmarchaeota archaeon]|nr:hypothetical protein [Candidatus Aenigmarchaeota archaeon]